MASLSTGHFLVMLFAAILLLSHPVICDNDEEKSLLQGLNNYRKTQGLPALRKNDQADCLADKIAEKLEKQPCTNTNGVPPPGAQPQFKDYPNLLSKCHVDNRTALNGTILPVCVRKLDPNMVLSNYTRSNHAKFLNNSNYITAGIGSEEDWMVVVLFANTTAGTTTPPGGSSVPTAPGAAGGTATPPSGAAGGTATPSTVPGGTSANAAASVFEGSLGYGLLLFMGLVHIVIYLLN